MVQFLILKYILKLKAINTLYKKKTFSVTLCKNQIYIYLAAGGADGRESLDHRKGRGRGNGPQRPHRAGADAGGPYAPGFWEAVHEQNISSSVHTASVYPTVQMFPADDWFYSRSDGENLMETKTLERDYESDKLHY